MVLGFLRLLCHLSIQVYNAALRRKMCSYLVECARFNFALCVNILVHQI